jgi:sensor domain CHASE-containing protein
MGQMHLPVQSSWAAAPAWLRKLVDAIGGACAFLALAVIAGWLLRAPVLIQLYPNLAPMQFNTALCILLGGAALIIWSWGRAPGAIPVLGGIIALVGCLTLGEYASQRNLGIDQLLFRCYIMTETSSPGRMSPVSAFCFVLTGSALLCLTRRARGGWRPMAIASAAAVMISISSVAILGYIYGLPGTYGWGQLTRIAVHTAVAFALFGWALLLIAWNIALRPGERSPRWLPIPLALGAVSGSIILSFALQSRQDDQIAQTVKAGAEGARNQVALRMDARIRALARMADRWEFSGPPPRAVWEADASSYIRDFPDLQAIEWIDAGHRVRWVVPLAGNEEKINLNLTLEERRQAAVAQAEREGKPVLTRPVGLFRGGVGFILYVPLVVNGHSDGLIAAVFDAQTCLARYLSLGVAEGEAIQIYDGDEVFFQRDAGAGPASPNWVAWEKIDLHGATWQMRIWPTPELAERLDPPLPQVILVAGWLAAVLLATVCFYGQRSSRHAAESDRANAALQAALDKVKTLEGLLPICSGCKRVRDDGGYWNQIDTYLQHHTNASISHGYCPECAAKAFKEFGFAVPDEVQAALEAQNYE